MSDLNFGGLLIGAGLFLMIGIFHPIVIKAEYYFGVRCWWVFLLSGLLSAAVSLFIESQLWSVFAGVFAFTCFWSIFEIFEQRKRVEKGWFPKRKR